jgi:uncharacterized ParB-like nuclease family protein
LPSTLDESKVNDFSCKLQVWTLQKWKHNDTAIFSLISVVSVLYIEEGVLLTPIEVAWVEHKGQNYYFAFGGCHRLVGRSHCTASFMISGYSELTEEYTSIILSLHFSD